MTLVMIAALAVLLGVVAWAGYRQAGREWVQLELIPPPEDRIMREYVRALQKRLAPLEGWLDIRVTQTVLHDTDWP